MPGPPAGLCNICAFQRVVGNTRGSVFSMCERAKLTGETEYAKYPRLPVWECPGYEPAEVTPER
ncbi:hypothetical protein GKE82_00975 [Conexibacter sp. W3-3-2]|uniref:Uncharacterized protein n=1 Tax=Paraconexibacter algicola TaxID=2133960 RepID=A0A2T4UEK3_9ACTN|nr:MULTISPECIES: hypothetical protein [Solirubrobacterales]MTD42911.1 hypothetical protein [Conexibacter sp. W3-3-2]PTL56175.1 hypothetical protein C7Y72_14380 [Paraconexibacter algicola]